MTSLAALAVGFVAGSVPFGYLLVRAAGRGDVREYGSGNIGATNVARTLGAGGWVATLAADAGKGVLGVAGGGWLGGEVGAALGGLGAVLGHCYTPWLGGLGGKGVATTLGAFGMLVPAATGIGVVVFAVVAGVGRIVSVASLAAVATLALVATLRADPAVVVACAWGAGLVVTIRHRDNLVRLREGREGRQRERAR